MSMPLGNRGRRRWKMLKVRGVTIEVLKAFLEAHSEVTISTWGDGVAFTAYDGPDGYYTRLVVKPQGVEVKESWGQESFHDSWAIDTGEARYTGTVEGTRYLPVWLAKALG
jgi:hypothetical protein